VAGVVLAAGSGRRYGRPKALVDNGSGPWVWRALDVVRGCEPRVVVVGAAADQVAALLPPGVVAVRNADHATGMGSSLRVGLQALVGRASVDAAVIMLVDLPGVGPEVIDRVCRAAGAAPVARGALVRAAFAGVPGHPVLLGREHWPGVIAVAVGDRGARDYLSAHPAVLVECGDIGSGVDVDTPEQGRAQGRADYDANAQRVSAPDVPPTR
jgi:CTP:molybdopterin cytidylyltransferase MocA